MPFIFEKAASKALERTFMQPVAANTERKAEREVATNAMKAFSVDTLKLSADRSVDRSVSLSMAKNVAVETETQATDGVAREVEEKFGKNGLRTNLDDAIRAWSDAHPKAPTPKQIEGFQNGSGNEKVNDFVTPIVTYRPRNPTLVPTAAEAEQMHAMMQKNGRQMVGALRTLPTKDRMAFHDVWDKLKHRPDGQLALQQLLLDGKLSMGGAGRPERNLIQALGDLAKDEKLDTGIRHRQVAFLAQLTQELSDPVAVSQHYKGTCAATSRGQILWSMKNPTDYTDFVHDLARPEGKAKLPNGKLVQRPADWDAGNDKSPNPLGLPGVNAGGGRTIASQLTEPVFMQVGYGNQYRYSNTFDAAFSWKQPNKQVMDGGLFGEQEARLLESLFPGKKFSVIYHTKADMKDSFASVSERVWNGERTVMSKDEAMQLIKSNAAIDNPIPVGVNYELSGGHAVLVTGVREVDLPAEKGVKGSKPIQATFIDYINPWGQRETMREDAFKTVMDGLTPDDSVAGVVGG